MQQVSNQQPRKADLPANIMDSQPKQITYAQIVASEPPLSRPLSTPTVDLVTSPPTSVSHQALRHDQNLSRRLRQDRSSDRRNASTSTYIATRPHGARGKNSIKSAQSRSLPSSSTSTPTKGSNTRPIQSSASTPKKLRSTNALTPTKHSQNSYRPSACTSTPTKHASQPKSRPTSGTSTPNKSFSQPNSRPSSGTSTPNKNFSQLSSHPTSGTSTPSKCLSQPKSQFGTTTPSKSFSALNSRPTSGASTSYLSASISQVSDDLSYQDFDLQTSSSQSRSGSPDPEEDCHSQLDSKTSQGPDDSKPVMIFIDNSNLWINAQQVAAKSNCLIPKKDHRVSFDLLNLTDFITKGRKIADCKLYGSEPPHVDALWKKLEEYGCVTNIYERSKWTGKEKEVDTAMTADIVETAFEKEPATIAVVSGDSDFRSGIEKALKKGWKVEVYSWKQALSSRIKQLSADNDNVMIIYLDDHLDDIIFVRRNFKLNEGQPFPSSLIGVRMHMKHNFFPEHEPTEDWCKKLEEVSRWPFRYCWLSATSDDLLLVFKKTASDTNEQQFFDIDNFLQQLKRDPLAGMETIEKYEHCNTEEDCNKRCPHKFCCQYGDEDCYFQHTDEEKIFFEQNGGVGLPRIKVLPCKEYSRNRCPKEAKDCTLAHGYEDALCPNCGKTGHFEYKCPKQSTSENQ